MSTLNVTTIQHESASGNNIVLDSDGNVEIASELTTAGAGDFPNLALKPTSDGAAFIQATNQKTGKVVANHFGSGRIALSDDLDTKTKIELNGSDGSITSTGDTQLGGNPSNGENTGLSLRASGEMVISRAASKDAITLYKNGSSTKTFVLKSDGTAEFKSTVSTTGALKSDRSSGGYYCFQGFQSGTEKSYIRADGNASFESTRSANLFIELDRDNPDSWKVTQEQYQEDVTGPLGKAEKTVTKTREVKEYIGKTLSVRDELQALRARATQQDAVIAQLVTALRSQGVTIDTTEVKE